MIRNDLTPLQVQSTIHALIQAHSADSGIRHNGLFRVTVKDANQLASKIAQCAFDHGLVKKMPTWSGRYLIQCYMHPSDQPPGKAFMDALQLFGQLMDDMPTVRAGVVEVQVFAKPNLVEPGTIVLTESRKCKRPSCPISFIPRVHNQKYCSIECRRAHYDEKASNNGKQNQ